MTLEEYFNGWTKVIDKKEFDRIMKRLKLFNPNILCPNLKDVFKPFNLCPYNECKVVFIGGSPCNIKDYSSGILFGNKNNIKDDNVSLELDIVKESVINYEIPHNPIAFDNSLESWARQGILMLHSSLTTEVNKTNAHWGLWKEFMQKLLTNLSSKEIGLIYVLFGKEAQYFKPYISNTNIIIESLSPLEYHAKGLKMPYNFWRELNNKIYYHYKERITYFKEFN